MAQPQPLFQWFLQIAGIVQEAIHRPRTPEPEIPVIRCNPPSPTSNWLRSEDMFGETLNQTEPIRIPDVLIIRTTDPQYINTLLTLYNQALTLSKILNPFFGATEQIHYRVDQWMPHAEKAVSRITEVRDLFGDLGGGERIFRAWKELEFLLKWLDEMLVDAKKITEVPDTYVEHGFVRDVWTEDVSGGMEKLLEGLRTELEEHGCDLSDEP